MNSSIKTIVIKDDTYINDIMEIENHSFSDPWSLELFKEEINRDIATVVGAIYENKLVGYGGFWAVMNEGHITNVAVSRDYRRMGVGTLILKEMMTIAKSLNINKMFLEVRVSNMSAIALYKSFGFSGIGIRKAYYEDNKEDALIMESGELQ